MRAEPGRERAAELAATEAFLANAHRLIRTSLSLEAALRDEGALPQLPELSAFAGEVDDALSAIAVALRDRTLPQVRSPRPAERKLAKAVADDPALATSHRSEEHTSELQSLMRISYAVFCLKKKKKYKETKTQTR